VRSYILRGHPPNAELQFETLDYSETHRVSLLRIRLITGKTHQIRVQANSRQHPLMGDDIYGDFSWNKKIQRTFGLKRLFLHAIRLEFTESKSKRKLSIEAPLPSELSDFLKKAQLQIASKTVATP